jgi:hypothetical protein
MNGTLASASLAHTGIEVVVTGRTSAARLGGNPHRGAAEFERNVYLAQRRDRIRQRHDRDRQHAVVDGAELGDGAVEGAATAVANSQIVVVQERRQRKRPEYELGVKAQQIERVGPFDGSNAPERSYALGPPMTFCSSTAICSAECRLLSAYRAAPSPWAPPEAVDSGGSASITQLSACRCKKSGSSMMWLSASRNVPPVAYGMRRC